MPPNNPTPEEVQALEDAIKSLNETRAKELEIMQRIANAAGGELDTITARIGLLEEQAEKAKSAATEMATMLAKAEQTADAEEALYSQITEAIEELDKKKRDGLILSKEEEEQLERLQELREHGKDGILEEVDARQKQADTIRQVITEQAHLQRTSQRLGNATGQLANSVFGLNEHFREDGLAGAFAGAIVDGGHFGTLVESLKENFESLTNPVKIIGNLLTNTFRRAQELGDLAANIRQTTGAGREMNAVFLESHRSTMLLGMTASDTSKSIGTLYQGFAGFTALSSEAQTRLASFTTTLELFDIDARDATEATDFLQMGLQMTNNEAMNTQAGLVGLGKALKVPPSIIMKDFVTAQRVIGAFGKQGITVFKQLSAQSKATGVDMQGLLGIAEGFDTFESAADKVGSLNAMLGGAYFDTMEMVSASEAERIELIRDGIEASGDAWTSMGRFEKRAIMNAAGITDMTEANKLFGNSLEVYYEQEAAAAAATGSIDGLSEAAKENMGISQKMSAIMMRMSFVVEGLINLWDNFLDGILWAMDALEPVFWVFEKIIGAIATLASWLAKPIGGIMVFIMAFTSLAFVVKALVAFLVGPFLAALTAAGAAVTAAGGALAFLGSAFTGAMTAAMGFVTTAGAALMGFISAAIPAIVGFGTALWAAMAPLLPIIAIVAAVAAGIAFLIKLFTDGPQFIFDFFGSIIDGIGTVLAFIVTLPFKIIGMLADIVKGIISMAGEIVIFLSRLPGMILGFVWTIIKGIGTAIVAIPGLIIDAFVGAFNFVVDLIAGIPAAIWGFILDIGDMLGNIGRTVLENLLGETLGGGIADFFGGIYDFVVWIVEGIGSLFGGLFDIIVWPFKKAFDVIMGIIGGIMAGFKIIGDGIATVFSKIVDIFKTPFNILIDGINLVIGALNSISFTVPEWVPIVGGKHFGLDISEIEHFETGGIVGETGIAMVHAGEVILPAEKIAGANAAINELTPPKESFKPAEVPGPLDHLDSRRATDGLTTVPGPLDHLRRDRIDPEAPEPLGAAAKDVFSSPLDAIFGSPMGGIFDTVSGLLSGESPQTTALMSKIDELITIMTRTAGAKPTDAAQKEVVLEVSGRRLGKVVYEDFIKDRLQPIIDSGG